MEIHLVKYRVKSQIEIKVQSLSLYNKRMIKLPSVRWPVCAVYVYYVYLPCCRVWGTVAAAHRRSGLATLPSGWAVP